MCDTLAGHRASSANSHIPMQDRLSIHSQKAGASDAPNAYFFNYFSLGLDFMLDPTSHAVVKIIMHSNTPGEVLFGRYAKCRWTLAQADSEGKVLSEDEVSRATRPISACIMKHCT